VHGGRDFVTRRRVPLAAEHFTSSVYWRHLSRSKGDECAAPHHRCRGLSRIALKRPAVYPTTARTRVTVDTAVTPRAAAMAEVMGEEATAEKGKMAAN